MKGKIEELRCGDVQGFAIRSGIKAGQVEKDPLVELKEMGSSLRDEGPQGGGSIRV